MKIVVKNNRVLAHGGEYIAFGSAVIDTESQKLFPGATIAECKNCPPDIDFAGYEYRGGEFVPCAPFGLGSGNLAVVCNEDSKAIKDSGFSIDTFAGMEVLPYTGTGTGTANATVTFTFNSVEPTIVFFQPQYTSATIYGGFVCGAGATAISLNSNDAKSYFVRVERNGKEITLISNFAPETVFNKKDIPYIAVAFGKRVNEG